MKKGFKLNLRQKLQFFILVTTLVVFAAAIGYISIRSKNIATQDATKLVNSYTEGYAAKIESSFNEDMAAVRTLAHGFYVHLDFEEIEEFRALIKEMYKHVMEGNPDFYAIWDSWEYSHIDPEWELPYGRIAQTWWRENDRLEFLEFERSLDGDPDLYGAAKQAGNETIWEPYLDQIDEGKKELNLMTTLTVPMFHQNNYIGLVGLDITLERLQRMIEGIRIYDDSYAFLVSYGGVYAAHPNSNLLEFPLEDHLRQDASEHSIIQNIQNGEVFSFTSSNEKDEPFYYSFHPVKVGETDTPWAFAIAVPVNEIVQDANMNFIISIITGLIGLIIIGIVISFVAGNISKPIQRVTKFMRQLANGRIDESMKLDIKTNDEIEEMATSFNISIDALLDKTNFATSIGSGDLNSEVKLLSDDDVLGKALIEMRDSLRKAEEDEKKRKEEDSKRRWANEGFTLFADILRQSDNDLKKLSENVVRNMVKYLDANQGGLFILNDDDEKDKFLELMSCYAFDREKFMEKKIKIGEGLVGTCFIEQKTIYMTKVPENYINITSGLGGENPKSILIVPLKLNEEVLGVIELASFKEFEQYQIEFVEKIAESIASSISNVKINSKTAYLLEQSQQQAEEMRAQEEETRQNMEELQATQEVMERKQEEQETLQEELKKEEALLHAILETIPDYVYFKDKECKFIRVSKSMVKLINAPGCESSDDLIGMSDFDFHTKENAQKQYDDEQQIMNGEKPPMINEVVKENFDDGTEQWVSVTKMPLKDKEGNVIGIWGISKLITELKKAELEKKAKIKAAEELDRKLKQIIKDYNGLYSAVSNTAIVIEFSPDGFVLNANKEAQKLFNMTERELKDKKHSDLLRSKDESKEDYSTLWDDLQKGNIKQRKFTGVINDEHVTLSEAYCPITDNDDNLIKITTVMVKEE